jgi:hypothetical protein
LCFKQVQIIKLNESSEDPDEQPIGNPIQVKAIPENCEMTSSQIGSMSYNSDNTTSACSDQSYTNESLQTRRRYKASVQALNDVGPGQEAYSNECFLEGVQQKAGSDVGALVGGIIGGLIGFVVLVVVIFFLWRRLAAP